MEALLTCVSRPLLVRGLQYPSPSPAAPSPTREKSLKKETSFIWSLLSLLLHLLLFWLLLTPAPWIRSGGGVSGNSIQENIRIKTEPWYIKLFILLTFIWVNSQKHYWFGIKLVNTGNNSLIPNCYSCLKVGKPWFFSLYFRGMRWRSWGYSPSLWWTETSGMKSPRVRYEPCCQVKWFKVVIGLWRKEKHTPSHRTRNHLRSSSFRCSLEMGRPGLLGNPSGFKEFTATLVLTFL